MPYQQQPNPDDRSNNVERLKSMIENTLDNIEEAEDTLRRAGSEEQEKIKEKNKRREQSVNAMREEMQDEAEARKRSYH